MKNTGKKEAAFIIKSMSEFVDSYAPKHLTNSVSTLKSYKMTLRKYLAFLEDVKGVKETTICKACFERCVIEEWMRYMRDQEGLTPDTCNVRLGGFRTFLKYLGSRDVEYKYLYLEAIEIPLMKTVKKKVNGLTREAVKAIMAEPDQTTVTGRRDLAFLALAYSTGARIGEILSIKVKDIHLNTEKPNITVLGKGGKIRTLYIPSKAKSHLNRYIQEAHGDHPSSEDYLFYSRNGNERNCMSPPAFESRLRLYANRAHEKCEDVPLKLHAHQLRHARATHWLEDGINIVQISFLLGHEQLATTMKYLDITEDDMKRRLEELEDEKDDNIPKWKKSLKDIVK